MVEMLCCESSTVLGFSGHWVYTIEYLVNTQVKCKAIHSHSRIFVYDVLHPLHH